MYLNTVRWLYGIGGVGWKHKRCMHPYSLLNPIKPRSPIKVIMLFAVLQEKQFEYITTLARTVSTKLGYTTRHQRRIPSMTLHTMLVLCSTWVGRLAQTHFHVGTQKVKPWTPGNPWHWHCCSRGTPQAGPSRWM